ncbi:MAG: hypothetical protein CMM49_09325 [Rhodospirillaceae bacterium]|nr:hypothetical protein [Rhodospirillaceae bacterium]|tara:strand:+ start:9708 stop:10364 length:657 start_codon:yes stop_codon:yes gene_type:complete
MEKKLEKQGFELLTDNNEKNSFISYRYSRFVSLIKLIFLATASALVLLIVAWSFSSPSDEKITISLSNSKPIKNISEGLTNGRFIGKDDNDQTYIITADYAEPINGNPREIALQILQADLTLDDGTWITLKAPGGILKRSRNELLLGDSVYIYADNRFEVFTNLVKIDLSKSIITSDNQINMQSPYGNLVANSFNFDNNKNNLYFSNVKLIFNAKQLP